MLRYRLTGTRSQLDDVSACCEGGVGRGCESLDRVYLEGSVRILFFADGTRQLLQAPYHCCPRFFTQGATIQRTTGAQDQYRETRILEVDIHYSLSPASVSAVTLSFTQVRSNQPAAAWTCQARPSSQVTTDHLLSGQWHGPG